MFRRCSVLILGVILVCIAVGCSNSNPLSMPGLDTPGPGTPGIETGREAGEASNHFALGLWQFTADPYAETLEIVLLRNGNFHLNAMIFLEPPPPLNITLGNLKFNGNIIDVDVGLRHPLIGFPQFTSFDVCGILITNGSITGFSDPNLRMAGPGDTRLLNPDGYSRWWNPAEFPVNLGTMFSYNDGVIGTPNSTAKYNCTLNAYKYYADELGPTDPLANLSINGRGVFTTGKKNIRHYTIELGTDGLIFNYAVDACWKMPQGKPPWDIPDDFGQEANRPEAYRISVVETYNSLHTGGGELDLEIWVYDWFNPELNRVTIEAPGAINPVTSSTPVSTGDGYAIYSLQAVNCTPPIWGNLDILISIASEQTGYGGLLPGIPITAYFIHTTIVNPCGWAKTWGGDDLDLSGGVAVDGNGNIYVTGIFGQTVDFDPSQGVDEHTSNGYLDTFLSKFDSNGEFQWAYTWGGSGPWDYGRGINIDGSGNVYVTGSFGGTTDFDPGPGVDEHTPSGNAYNVFLSKFDSKGEFQWARTWGGPKSAWGHEVAIDASGKVYVTGMFYDTVDFNPGPEIDKHISNGFGDIYLSKFDSDGEFQWVRTWGGIDNDYGNSIAIDGSGNPYITGFFSYTVDFDPGSGVDEHTSNGDNEIFLSKFDSDGEFQWARTWGGMGLDYGTGVAIDEKGNAHVTGTFEGTIDLDPDSGVDEHTTNGENDIFLSKFDSNGEFQWGRTWGGVYYDSGSAVAIYGNGNVYVAGSFNDTVDFNPGPGVDIHISKGDYDAFLSKFNPDGEFQWARTWGGDDKDYSRCVAADGSGKAYVTGRFYDIVDFDPGPGVNLHKSNGNSDAFLSKFPPDGNW